MPPLVEPGTLVVDPLGKPVCTVLTPIPYMSPLTMAYFIDWQTDVPVDGQHIRSIPWLSVGNNGILIHTIDGWRRLMRGRDDD